MKIINISLILLFVLPNLALCGMEKIEKLGTEFSEGVGVTNVDVHFGSSIKLYGLYFPGYVIYEFPIGTEPKKVAIDLQFQNPRKQQLDIYVWNYGSKKVDSTLKKENLQDNWILWESTARGENWKSNRPKYLNLREGNGIIDYLGSDGILKVLLYADGGEPPYSDELFFIDKITLYFPQYDYILQRVAKLDSVWIEGDYLIAKGFGYSSEANTAISKESAKRAATLDAYRNLARAIYGTQKSVDSDTVEGKIKGAQIKDINYLDNSVEILLQMPLSMVE